MTKKKSVQIERTAGGIIKLRNTISSKSNFYKFHLKGTWDAGEKCWTLPTYDGTDETLVQECADAPYNRNSKAAYFERRNAEELKAQKSDIAYEALMAKWERGEVPHDERSEWAREHGATASKYSRAEDFSNGVLICDAGCAPGRSIEKGYVIGKKEAVIEAMIRAWDIDAHCIMFSKSNWFEWIKHKDQSLINVFDLPDGRAMNHYRVNYE